MHSANYLVEGESMYHYVVGNVTRPRVEMSCKVLVLQRGFTDMYRYSTFIPFARSLKPFDALIYTLYMLLTECRQLCGVGTSLIELQIQWGLERQTKA